MIQVRSFYVLLNMQSPTCESLNAPLGRGNDSHHEQFHYMKRTDRIELKRVDYSFNLDMFIRFTKNTKKSAKIVNIILV